MKEESAMKRKFLSAVFSITLAACLFSNTVFASELGNTESPAIAVETEVNQPESEESGAAEESSEASEESGAAEESSEASEESSAAEESSESSEESSAADESSEASEESSAAEEPGESGEESSAAEESSESSEESSAAEEPGESGEESSEAEEPSESDEESSVVEEPGESSGESSAAEEPDESDEESSEAEESTESDPAEEEISDEENSEVFYAGTTDGWTFSVSGSYATIVGYAGTSTVLNIPSTVRDSQTSTLYKVAAIGDSAFYQNTLITKVTVPDSVTSIGSSAFNSCSNLKEVELGNGVTTIGSYAFANSGIRYMIFPNSVTTLGTRVLHNCDFLGAIEVNCQVSEIPEDFASYCDRLTCVKLGENVTGWYRYAFRYTPMLKAFYYAGDKVTRDGSSVFDESELRNSGTVYCNYGSEYDRYYYSSSSYIGNAKKAYALPAVSTPKLEVVEDDEYRGVLMTTSTEGAIIYYSTKNDISMKSEWVASGNGADLTYYQGTIYAKAYLCGAWSSVTSITLPERKVPKPTFAVKGVIGGRNVTFSSKEKGAVIYYSTKGSNDITTSSKRVENGETVLFENFYGSVYAKAYYNGQWSDASRLILKIPVVSDPVISYTGDQVTISTRTPDAYIYYTTDGTTPSVNNGKRLSKSKGTFTLPSGTVRAIAVRSCFTSSNVVKAVVKPVVDGSIKVPSFKVQGVIGGRTVTFNTKQSNAVIYYSTTSSTITTADHKVGNGGSVTFTDYYGTVYARTYYNGKWSNVSKLVLKIPVVNTPTISYDRNGYYRISTTTPNCTIYYTVDGSTPSPNNGRKISASSGRVYIGYGRTIKAIAVRSCFTNSKIGSN